MECSHESSLGGAKTSGTRLTSDSKFTPQQAARYTRRKKSPDQQVESPQLVTRNDLSAENQDIRESLGPTDLSACVAESESRPGGPLARSGGIVF